MPQAGKYPDVIVMAYLKSSLKECLCITVRWLECVVLPGRLLWVMVDTESTELRWLENVHAGVSQEHPRSSTTDDVECFFSVMRDAAGWNFTQEHAQVQFWKIGRVLETHWPGLAILLVQVSAQSLLRRSLPGLQRHSAFKTQETWGEYQMRVTSSFGATLPVTNSLSVRLQFHSRPLALPPPPTCPIQWGSTS